MYYRRIGANRYSRWLNIWPFQFDSTYRILPIPELLIEAQKKRNELKNKPIRTRNFEKKVTINRTHDYVLLYF